MDNYNVKTTIDDQEFIDDYAEALNTVPPEVRAFLWSDVFTIILNVIGDTFKLNDNQKDMVRKVAKETLIGILTPVSRRIMLADVGIVGELQDNILNSINEEIISRALVQVEDYTELYGNKDVSTETSINSNNIISAPSPVQALASIQERLSQASTIAPVKRDYSVEKPGEISSGTVTAPKPLAPDPYREMPEE